VGQAILEFDNPNRIPQDSSLTTATAASPSRDRFYNTLNANHAIAWVVLQEAADRFF
jgi:hypothetical protein